MSHELRTPLNSILGYTGMIQDKMLGELSPKQEKAIAKVMARSNDLLSMIANILNVTKIG
jgi:signal transduction histidine kinase